MTKPPAGIRTNTLDVLVLVDTKSQLTKQKNKQNPPTNRRLIRQGGEGHKAFRATRRRRSKA